MITRLQAHLEAIYGFRCEARAIEYLVDDAAARRLGGTGRSAEELLVSEGEDQLEVGLYFSAELLERLKRFEDAPAEEVLEAELSSYCQLAEGVSHFLYLAHTAAQERQVSLLELEAQAEVDKFAACLLPRWNAGAVAWSRELLERLFDKVRYNEQLSPEERRRYVEANRVSRAYCKRLLRHVTARRMDRLLTELRYCYRLGAEAKLRYLAAPG